MITKKDFLIYPVITPEFCGGREPVFVLTECLKAGVKIVQLRDKKEPEKYAAEFRRLTKEYGALFFLNDSLDLALKYQADGVHLGQDDLSVAEARKRCPNLIIGASVTNLAEAVKAEKDGASYITIGPIFPTSTKSDYKKVVGLAPIKEILSVVNIPVSVIGGINKNNLDQLLKLGVRQFAMVTAITEAAEVGDAVNELLRIVFGHN